MTSRSDTAHTFGLFRLSAAFEGVRKECKQWKWRAQKAEGELEELRMHLHQFAACQGDAKETARLYLKAEAQAYHSRVNQ